MFIIRSPQGDACTDLEAILAMLTTEGVEFLNTLIEFRSSGVMSGAARAGVGNAVVHSMTAATAAAATC